MTTLSLADWLNFSVASIEAEKMFVGLGPVLVIAVMQKSHGGKEVGKSFFSSNKQGKDAAQPFHFVAMSEQTREGKN